MQKQILEKLFERYNIDKNDMKSVNTTIREIVVDNPCVISLVEGGTTEVYEIDWENEIMYVREYSKSGLFDEILPFEIAFEFDVIQRIVTSVPVPDFIQEKPVGTELNKAKTLITNFSYINSIIRDHVDKCISNQISINANDILNKYGMLNNNNISLLNNHIYNTKYSTILDEIFGCVTKLIEGSEMKNLMIQQLNNNIVTGIEGKAYINTPVEDRQTYINNAATNIVKKALDSDMIYILFKKEKGITINDYTKQIAEEFVKTMTNTNDCSTNASVVFVDKSEVYEFNVDSNIEIDETGQYVLDLSDIIYPVNIKPYGVVVTENSHNVFELSFEKDYTSGNIVLNSRYHKAKKLYINKQHVEEVIKDFEVNKHSCAVYKGTISNVVVSNMPDNIEIDIDENIANAKINIENTITVTGVKQGETTLRLSATGFRPIEIPVLVRKNNVLEIENDTYNVIKGETTNISIPNKPTDLKCVANDDIVTVSIENDGLSVLGVNEGETEIVLSANTFDDATINIVVETPIVPPIDETIPEQPRPEPEPEHPQPELYNEGLDAVINVGKPKEDTKEQIQEKTAKKQKSRKNKK